MGDEVEDGTILGRPQVLGLLLCHRPPPHQGLCPPVASVASLENVLLSCLWTQTFPSNPPTQAGIFQPNLYKIQRQEEMGGKKMSMKKSGKTNTNPRQPGVLTKDWDLTLQQQLHKLL